MSAEHAQHPPHSHAMTSDEKVRQYLKVFVALFVITILEVSCTRLPGPKMIRDTMITVLACTKAGAVGYYYMHLNHETKWLRMVALLPIIMFFYSAVLIPDTSRNRPTSAYLPLRERVMPTEEAEVGEETKEETVPNAPAAPETAAREVKEINAAPTAEAASAPGSSSSGSVADKAPAPVTPAPPPAAAAAGTAPSATGSSDWR